MFAGKRQQLGGLVLNERKNVPRDDYDRLRATLHNAARLGPESQNHDRHDDYRAHLAGKIAWVTAVNPSRGARLRAMFENIAWPTQPVLNRP